MIGEGSELDGGLGAGAITIVVQVTGGGGVEDEVVGIVHCGAGGGAAPQDVALAVAVEVGGRCCNVDTP